MVVVCVAATETRYDWDWLTEGAFVSSDRDDRKPLIEIMPTTLEVLFAPAEFTLLTGRDLRETVCVVFDVLRATSTMVTALGNGAAGMVRSPRYPRR